MNAGSRGTNVSLYFLDVLACLLFCLAVALAGARFGREHSVEIELPSSPASESAGPALGETVIEMWLQDGVERIEVDGVPVAPEALEGAIQRAASGSVLIRSEASTLSRVVGLAHAAGVEDIQLAYRSQTDTPANGTRRASR